MALIIPPGFAHAVFRIQLTGDAEEMVTTCGVDVSAFGGDFQEAADVVAAYFALPGGPAETMTVQYTFNGVTLYVGQDGGSTIPFDSVGITQGGLDNAQSLPQNCAYLIRKKTGLGSRRGRGRFYMPSVNEVAVSAIGVIGGAQLGAVQAAWTEFFEACRDGVGEAPAAPLVVLHDAAGAGVEPPPTVITALEVDDVIATQRQRLRK